MPHEADTHMRQRQAHEAALVNSKNKEEERECLVRQIGT